MTWCAVAIMERRQRLAMRTTLDIEDDVLAAAKELARRQGVSAGQVVSRLLRYALTGEMRAQPSDVPVLAGFVPLRPVINSW
jgi:hypothetical protein